MSALVHGENRNAKQGKAKKEGAMQERVPEDAIGFSSRCDSRASGWVKALESSDLEAKQAGVGNKSGSSPLFPKPYK